MATIADMLDLARQHHQQGALNDAEYLCRQVLQVSPNNAEALHRLGVLKFQQADFAAAVEHFAAAVAAEPANGNFRSNLGLAYQALNRMEMAVASLRESVRLMPTSAEAHYNLANALRKLGHNDDAAVAYQQTLHLKPGYVQAHNNLGVVLQEREQYQAAEQHFREAIRLNPGHVLAHNNLGNALKKQGQLAEAAACYRQAISLKPDFDQAHNNLGIVLQEQGQTDEALARFQEALRINPGMVGAYLNLGNLLHAQGRIEEAVDAYHQALHVKSDCAEAYSRLGDLWQGQGRLEEAVACYRLALGFQPDDVKLHNNLGNVLRLQGKTVGAAASYRQALRLKPDCEEAYYNLGGLFADSGDLAAAVTNYEEALRINPDFADAHSALGAVFNDMGQMDEAVASWRQAMRIKPSDRLKLAVATRLPIVYQSMADLESWRNRVVDQVRELHERQVVFDVTDEPAMTLFYLPYQGLNDRAIQRDVGRLCRAPAPQIIVGKGQGQGESHPVQVRGPSDKRIRIGFISSYFTTHTIGQLTRGLVANLSRNDFDVTVLSIGNFQDDVAGFFKQHADHYLPLPRRLLTARAMIAERQLDVLYFTDVGMDPITSTLAMSRLAPIQCVTWGHPVTTGLDTIDYFISGEDLETADGEQHYTEKLVRLKNLAVHYYRPELRPPHKDKSHFGLTVADHIYACPQSLFKLHPEFDELLRSILLGDPRGRLVLIEAKQPHWTQQLLQRFRATMPEVVDRCYFLPTLTRQDFLKLLAVSEVLLDPLHFVGGNTSYEAFAVGTPVVTLPSSFLRGRITYALYKQMNIMDCVAADKEDYVRIALRLGTDVAFRESIKDRILGACHVLFENCAGIRELEQFLHWAVDLADVGKELSSKAV